MRNQRGKSMIAWRWKELTNIQVQSISTSPRIYGRGGQDNEVIKDRFIRMQMMKDAQSGRMNPQAKSGLKHKLNNNLAMPC